MNGAGHKVIDVIAIVYSTRIIVRISVYTFFYKFFFTKSRLIEVITFSYIVCNCPTLWNWRLFTQPLLYVLLENIEQYRLIIFSVQFIWLYKFFSIKTWQHNEPDKVFQKYLHLLKLCQSCSFAFVQIFVD